MLKTCTRCRARRIRCDAQLPACQNCQKSGLSCLFHDDVLGEDIPRSYIKRLYDRIGELESLVSAHQGESESPSLDGENGQENEHASMTVKCGLQPFRGFVRTKTGYDLFLGSSPPVVIGNATLQNLLWHGIPLESPSMTLGAPVEDISPKTFKPDKSCLSPEVIRSLMSHYSHCIETVYPTGVTFAEDMETGLKQLGEVDRCKVILACAIAATHKSYYIPGFRVLSATCREWAGELTSSVLAVRDHDTVMVVTMLIIYELVDPERGLLWELLTLAQRLCLELGWHLENGNAAGDGAISAPLDQPAREKLLSTLLSIERPLSILSQRHAILSSAVSQETSSVYEKYQHCIDTLFAPNQSAIQGCPMSNRSSISISTLQSLPADDSTTREAWLLLHPSLINHPPCALCSLIHAPVAPPIQTGLHSWVMQEAAYLVNSVHHIVVGQDTFVPPMLAACRAFMGGCVIVTGIKNQWPGADSFLGALLKCSEILSFTAPLWSGGREYLRVYRQIMNSI